MTTPIALPKGSLKEQDGQRFIDIGGGFVPIETLEKGSVNMQGGTLFYTPALEDADVSLDDAIKTNVPDVENKDLTVSEYIGGRLGNIADSFKEDSAKRGESLSHTLSSFEKGEIPLKVMGQQALGTGAGMAFDTLGSVMIEGLGANFDAMKLFIPDDVEDAVKAKTIEGIKYLVNTDGGQAGVEALSKGQEAYTAFKEKYPVHAKNLESFVNVAMVGTPSMKTVTGKGIPNIVKEQIKGAGKNIDDLGRNIEAIGKKQARASIKIPKERETLRYYESFKDMSDENYLKKLTEGKFKFDSSDLSTIETLKKVKGYKPSGNPRTNLVRLNDENTRTLAQINKAIDASPVVIDKSRVINRLDESLGKLVRDNPLGNPQEMSRAVNDIRARAVAALKVMDDAPTPANLYKARKEFDRIMKEVKTDQIFTKGGAGSRAVKNARDTMNEMLEDAVTGVKGKLNHSSNLFGAIDDMVVKVQNKHDSHFMGVVKNMISAGSEARDVGFVLASMGLVGSYATAAPIIVGTGLGVGLTLKSSRLFWKYGINGKKGQQAIAAIKRGTGRAVQGLSKDGVSTLKADRAALIEGIEDAIERWENGGKDESRKDQMDKDIEDFKPK